MCPNPQKTADLVTFTEEILNGKFHFLCSVTEETHKQGALENTPSFTSCTVISH